MLTPDCRPGDQAFASLAASCPTTHGFGNQNARCWLASSGWLVTLGQLDAAGQLITVPVEVPVPGRRAFEALPIVRHGLRLVRHRGNAAGNSLRAGAAANLGSERRKPC